MDITPFQGMEVAEVGQITVMVSDILLMQLHENRFLVPLPMDLQNFSDILLKYTLLHIQLSTLCLVIDIPIDR